MSRPARSRTRPVGLSAGSIGLALAWFGGAAIARLTGATPVVILLAVAAVAAVVAAFESWWSIGRVRLGDPVVPTLVTQGDTAPIALDVVTPRPVWLEVVDGDEIVASGWSSVGAHRWSAEATFPHRGIVTDLELRVRTGGTLGLWWWQRRQTLSVEALAVGAAFGDREVMVERRTLSGDGEHEGRPGAVSGELDGIRPWREGDSERWVHWASSVRSGELMVHDRRQPNDAERIVRARGGTDDPDGEAGAARTALERSLRAGARTFVAIDGGDPVAVTDAEGAARWSAAADLGSVEAPPRRWWQRSWTAEPATPSSFAGRRWAAVATFISLAMLQGSLGLDPLLLVPIGLAVVLAALVSGRTLSTGEPPSPIVRLLVGFAALVGLGMVVASSGRLDGILLFLRGPLPQVLIILILIHGFECHDRRTVRVGVGISAVVVMYAAAFRVDDQLIWWLLAWFGAAGASLSALARPAEVPRAFGEIRARTGWAGGWGPWPQRAGYVGLTAVASVAALAVVPVPDGPARLTLPTIVEDAEPVQQPGGLAGPDGNSTAESGTSEPGTDRAPAGVAGAYTGFAESMDTSVRGALSDEVVMRVRAPAADFWRGQTFTRFDGRRWYADDEQGVRRRGPNMDIPITFGDLDQTMALEYDELIQTYHLEVDMPNLVFHAYRPSSVVLDSDLWVRPDGALRSSTTLPAGSVYTVVSTRPRVDAEVLRRQGHVDERLNVRGREIFARHLEVPASTTPETIALAAELAEGQESTYDVIRAYEAWMNANVEYDLDAPLPELGEDAVHDFLFDSRLGFCEQIASSLTIMLRSQGIPARLATGYTPGTRDRVSGVFEVRASDAHAWVEVWFPQVGWQAFDPTAAVPLSADSDVGSIGGDLASGASSYASDNAMTLVAAGGLVAVAIGGWRALRSLRRRRRRGRWGTLQDRFATRAVRRGARVGASNREFAEAWTAADDAAVAQLVATRLDRVAFAPDAGIDDELFGDTRRLVGGLPSTDRRGARSG